MINLHDLDDAGQVKIGGLTVTIRSDEGAEMPWTAWDHLPLIKTRE